MPKSHTLREVSAKSSRGMEIVVEQVYEKNLSSIDHEQIWSALPKIALSNKVIDLDQNHTFTHPGTGEVFKVLSYELYI